MASRPEGARVASLGDTPMIHARNPYHTLGWWMMLFTLAGMLTLIALARTAGGLPW